MPPSDLTPPVPPLPPDATTEQIAADLRGNPRYQPFFAEQRPEWVEDFIKTYAHQKFMALHYGDFSERQSAGRLTQWEEEAYQRLWDIQQKKLFDLQCCWRAGQVAAVPGVQSSYDFAALADDIENSAVLPPITEAELALYCEFLAQVDDYAAAVGIDDWDDVDWQSYDDFRAYEVDDDEESGAPLPEWYEFHNARTGAGALLALPDVRGPREQHYRDAHHAHQQAVRAAKAAQSSPAPTDPRPTSVPYDERRAIWTRFARQFEPGRFNRQLAAHLSEDERRAAEDGDSVEEAIELLRSLDDTPYPMRAHPDWREALRLTAGDARRDQVLAALPDVYEAYQLRQTARIQHPAEDGGHGRWFADLMNEQILNGRALLNEPRDFNF